MSWQKKLSKDMKRFDCDFLDKNELEILQETLSAEVGAGNNAVYYNNSYYDDRKDDLAVHFWFTSEGNDWVRGAIFEDGEIYVEYEYSYGSFYKSRKYSPSSKEEFDSDFEDIISDMES